MKARETQPGPLIQKILEKVKDVNASRRVRIDTYGFEGAGQWPEKVPWAAGGRLPPPPSPEETKQFVEFLKKLADDSGGTYRAIR
jgi:hypothetical protein